MILDGLLSFTAVGVPQVLTTTAVSDNVIDLKNARDIGVGDNPAMKLAIFCAGTFAGGTSLQIQAQSAPDNAGVPGTYVTLAESIAYPLADLLIGRKLFPIDWPALPDTVAQATFHRFLRLNFVIVGTMSGAGSAIDAKLVLDRQDNRPYPAGITISN